MRMASRTTPFPFLSMIPHLDGDLEARKVRALSTCFGAASMMKGLRLME